METRRNNRADLSSPLAIIPDKRVTVLQISKRVACDEVAMYVSDGPLLRVDRAFYIRIRLCASVMNRYVDYHMHSCKVYFGSSCNIRRDANIRTQDLRGND